MVIIMEDAWPSVDACVVLPLCQLLLRHNYGGDERVGIVSTWFRNFHRIVFRQSGDLRFVYACQAHKLENTGPSLEYQ